MLEWTESVPVVERRLAESDEAGIGFRISLSFEILAGSRLASRVRLHLVFFLENIDLLLLLPLAIDPFLQFADVVGIARRFLIRQIIALSFDISDG